MEWNIIETQDDIDFLLKVFNDFHDSCIVSMQYKSGAYVDKSNFSMNSINTERTLSLIFHSQFKNCSAIELVFDKLVKLNLEPNDENYDCIIFGATIKKENGKFFWADSPGCIYSSPSGTWIICEKLMWRKCEIENFE